MMFVVPETGERVELFSSPELERDLRAFQQAECDHPITELRRVRIAGDAIQVKKECQRCGEITGQAVRQTSASANLPLRSEAYRAKRESERQKILEKHWVKQNNRDSNWWESYSAYLRTPEWAAKRRRVLIRCQGRCEGCGNAEATEVHHLSYDRRFDEFLFDLVALCDVCHRRAHPNVEPELPCCTCRFLTAKFEVEWCGKFNIPAQAALSSDGRCGPTAQARDPLR